MIRKVVAALLFIICLGALLGCNTVKGLGEDIQSGGKAIERSSGK